MEDSEVAWINKLEEMQNEIRVVREADQRTSDENRILRKSLEQLIEQVCACMYVYVRACMGVCVRVFLDENNDLEEELEADYSTCVHVHVSMYACEVE